MALKSVTEKDGPIVEHGNTARDSPRQPMIVDRKMPMRVNGSR